MAFRGCSRGDLRFRLGIPKGISKSDGLVLPARLEPVACLYEERWLWVVVTARRTAAEHLPITRGLGSPFEGRGALLSPRPLGPPAISIEGSAGLILRVQLAEAGRVS